MDYSYGSDCSKCGHSPINCTCGDKKKKKVKVKNKKVDKSIYSDPKYNEIMQRNDGGMFGFHKD